MTITAMMVAIAILCLLAGFVGGRISTFDAAPAGPQKTFALPISVIARIVHEANRAYAASIGEMKKSWINIEPSVKASLIAGISYLLANPDATPEQMHEQWCRSKIEQGYRYGSTVDHHDRTHPCLVPYDQLPEHQRFKDYLFSAIVGLATPR